MMKAAHMAEIDTGPGLEAQFSWDYSHAKTVPSLVTTHREDTSTKMQQPAYEPHQRLAGDTKVEVSAQGLSEMNGDARTASGHEASTNGPPGDSSSLESVLTPVSAFQPASVSDASWHEGEPRESILPYDPPERAETVEEKDLRVRAEKRQARTEKAAQITSLAILSLLLIASTLFLVLAYTGWNVIAAAVALFCASVAGYPSLQLLWYALSSQMFRCWRELEPLERFKWGQKGASLVHSAIMACVGISIIVSGDWNKRDLVKSRDERVAAFLGLEIGYLLQDTGMEIYKQIAFRRSFSVLHWIHHLVILAALPWYYKYFKVNRKAFLKRTLAIESLASEGDFFFGVFFLWNTSTVPLQLRWFQASAGMQKGILYQLNNVALLLSFLPCRILIIPYLMYVYGSMKGWPLHKVPLEIPPSWTAASLGLMVINMIWLFKLLRNAFSRPRLRKRRKGKLS